MFSDLVHHKRSRRAYLAVGFGLAALTASPGLASDAFFDYPATKLSGETSAIFDATAERCRRICSERSGCTGFDYSVTDRACRLFTNVASAMQQTTFSAATKSLINGYRPPINPPQPAPLQEQSQWYFGAYANTDLYGGDLYPKGLGAASAQECARSCEADLRCNGFTFNTQQNRCFLKSGYSFAQIANGAVSGRFFKSLPSLSNSTGNLNVRWELFVGQDFPGNDLREAPAQAYDDCVSVCDRTSGCGGVTWVTYTTPDHCYLKSGNQLYPQPPRTPHQGLASARRSLRVLTTDSVVQVAPRD